jgi:hypothetical protein
MRSSINHMAMPHTFRPPQRALAGSRLLNYRRKKSWGIVKWIAMAPKTPTINAHRQPRHSVLQGGSHRRRFAGRCDYVCPRAPPLSPARPARDSRLWAACQPVAECRHFTGTWSRSLEQDDSTQQPPALIRCCSLKACASQDACT